MENKIEWKWVYSGSDFLASLLVAELKDDGIESRIKSQTEAALAAGFGSTGIAQIFVKMTDLSKAEAKVVDFNNRQAID